MPLNISERSFACRTTEYPLKSATLKVNKLSGFTPSPPLQVCLLVGESGLGRGWGGVKVLFWPLPGVIVSSTPRLMYRQLHYQL